MTGTKTLKHLTRTLEQESEGAHSDLYRWLAKHHGELTASFAEFRPAWSAVAKGIAAEGVKGADGQVASANSVRQMWQRLCRDIEARERERLVGAIPKKVPTHAPKGWVPPMVAKPTTIRTEPAPFAPTPNNQEAAKPAGAGPRDMLAELWSDIDKRSGR